MQAADRLLSTTRADVSMASSAMPMDTGCKTIACGRCALATTKEQDRAIGCSLLQVLAARRTEFLASSHLQTKVPRRTPGTIGRPSVVFLRFVCGLAARVCQKPRFIA